MKIFTHRFFAASALAVAAGFAVAQIGPGLPTPDPPAESKDKPRKDKKAKKKPDKPVSDPEYVEAVRRTATMSGNGSAQRMAGKHGLQILDLTWEDTGRFDNSAVGPNISDMTIQVATRERQGKEAVSKITCMPVIRFPNFVDKTCDIDPRDFTLLVGNQDGRDKLKRISLRDLLEEPLAYLSEPDSWEKKGGKPRTLIADRDSRALVSAQACFLPIPKGGEATFNPVLFNYQSYEGDPASPAR